MVYAAPVGSRFWTRRSPLPNPARRRLPPRLKLPPGACPRRSFLPPAWDRASPSSGSRVAHRHRHGRKSRSGFLPERVKTGTAEVKLRRLRRGWSLCRFHGCGRMHAGPRRGQFRLRGHLLRHRAVVAQNTGHRAILPPPLCAEPVERHLLRRGAGQRAVALRDRHPGCARWSRLVSRPGRLRPGLRPGAVDAQALVTQWAKPQATGTGPVNVTNTITASQPSTLRLLVLSAIVTSGNGGPAPPGMWLSLTSPPAPMWPPCAGRRQRRIFHRVDHGDRRADARRSSHRGRVWRQRHLCAANSQPVVVEVQAEFHHHGVTPATSTPAPGSTWRSQR